MGFSSSFRSCASERENFGVGERENFRAFAGAHANDAGDGHARRATVCGMTTLTIELPDDDARLAAEKARRAHMTLAEWIGLRIAGRRGAGNAGERDALGFPAGWFERTSGSLAEVEDFREPADPPVAPVAPLEL